MTNQKDEILTLLKKSVFSKVSKKDPAITEKDKEVFLKNINSDILNHFNKENICIAMFERAHALQVMAVKSNSSKKRNINQEFLLNIAELHSKIAYKIMRNEDVSFD